MNLNELIKSMNRCKLNNKANMKKNLMNGGFNEKTANWIIRELEKHEKRKTIKKKESKDLITEKLMKMGI
jgi:hypothetical protein